jgi:hypothetical protein
MQTAACLFYIPAVDVMGTFVQIKATPPELFGEHAHFYRNPEDCKTWVGGYMGMQGPLVWVRQPV